MTTIILNGTTAKPRLAYQNLLEDTGATITTDSDSAGYEYTNAYDWRTYTYWKPANGDHYIQAVLASPKPVDYLAYYSHDMHTNGATIKLQYSTDGGATWNDAITATPSSGDAAMHTLDVAITAQRWRVRVNSATASRLGVVSFGQSMALERGVWIGFSPPRLARSTEIDNNQAENGAYLGRAVRRVEHESALDLDFLTPAWVRSTWMPFVEHAELKPWFLGWNLTDYPDEIAYCWTEGRIQPPRYTKQAYMSTGLRFKCLLK